MVIRTEVELTDEQATALREIAAAEGHQDQKEAALSVAGRFRSGLPDLAERHDDYLAEDANE